MLFLLLLWAAIPYGYGWLEAKTDARKIAEDAEKDSLKERFHFWNFLERFGVALAASFVLYPLFGLAVSAAYFCYFGAVFGNTFTTQLNRHRGLATWYVSADERASFTDRLMVRYAGRFGVTPERFQAIVYRSALVVTIALFTGVVGHKMLISN